MIGAARHRGHRDRRRIGRRRAVQDLAQGRQRRAKLIAEEARNADACRHAEETTQGDWVVFVEIVSRHLPGDEPGVHVFIETEALRIEEAHGSHGDHEFRQRRRLKERVGRGPGTIGVSPRDAVVIDERDADRWDVERGHRVCERELFLSAADGDGEIALNVRRFRRRRRCAYRQGDGDAKIDGGEKIEGGEPPEGSFHTVHPHAALSISRARPTSSPRTHSWHSSRS